MDMHFYLVRYRAKKYLDVFWKPGVIKLGDYLNKNHPPAHHKGMRPIYSQCSNI